ncbi:hypothetical protein ACOSQ3_013482 [Xanthoceras sorbifolium]
MMLSLLILGPQQPGHEFDVYLAPLIANLKTLWDVGDQEYFTLRVVYSGLSMIYGRMGTYPVVLLRGIYFAYPIYRKDTYSCWLKHCRKYAYRLKVLKTNRGKRKIEFR